MKWAALGFVEYGGGNRVIIQPQVQPIPRPRPRCAASWQLVEPREQDVLQVAGGDLRVQELLEQLDLAAVRVGGDEDARDVVAQPRA